MCSVSPKMLYITNTREVCSNTTFNNASASTSCSPLKAPTLNYTQAALACRSSFLVLRW